MNPNHETGTNNATFQLSVFHTTCEQALEFYTRCGLGRVTAMLGFGVDGMPLPNEAMRNKIMHAQFEGPGVLFFASDNDDAEPMRGSAHILQTNDRAQTEQLFARLAQGGIRASRAP